MENLEQYRTRALDKGVNRLLYRAARLILMPFFKIFFRLEGMGFERLPKSGPLLLASNHRSFLDPFVIGAMMRRPIYYVAKRELFNSRPIAWVLSGLGAFPIDRGNGDQDAIATARAILERGDCVVIFPEGKRFRAGPLGSPRRGVGRLALETGAYMAPIAVIGTDGVRKGWRIRPKKVSLRCGRLTAFPRAESPSPALAAAVTERIWACIRLQWEWLGGECPSQEQRSAGLRERDRSTDERIRAA